MKEICLVCVHGDRRDNWNSRGQYKATRSKELTRYTPHCREFKCIVFSSLVVGMMVISVKPYAISYEKELAVEIGVRCSP